MATALDHIAAVLSAADTGAAIPPVTVNWMAAGLRTIAYDPRLRLEAALGITARGGVGGMSRQQRQDARDRLLQEMHRRFYPGLSPRPAARAILNMRDAMARVPSGPVNDAAILLDSILHLGVPLPVERHLARILG